MEGTLWGHSTGLGSGTGLNKVLRVDLQELRAGAIGGVTSACTTDVLGNTAALEKPQRSSDRKAPLFLSPYF